MAPLLSHIIMLIKSIFLHAPDSSKRPSAQFFAGKHPPYGFPTGIGLNWWYTEATFAAQENVTRLLIQESPEFYDCDPRTVSEVIKDTLHEICIDQGTFSPDDVIFAKKSTLFDCTSVSVAQCASNILVAIKDNLRAKIGRCCTVYAVPRFRPESFYIDEAKIYFISKSDRVAWQRLVDEGFSFDGWTPEDPRAGWRKDSIYSLNGKYEAVLVADSHGTKQGARFSSVLKFRVLLAVSFAIASDRAKYPYWRAAADSLEFCVQFPHRSSPDRTMSRNDCGALVPYYADDIPIAALEIAVIKKWYEDRSKCKADTKNRIEKAAHFLNLGMNADGTEAYINYFITLDALFGQRGSVETSILSGLAAIGSDAKTIEKARWLFDLRSEIVHGGSRYIEEWPNYARYTKHFRTKPMRDVQALAQASVLRAPHALA